jgi:hypothetical protein
LLKFQTCESVAEAPTGKEGRVEVHAGFETVAHEILHVLHGLHFLDGSARDLEVEVVACLHRQLL